MNESDLVILAEKIATAVHAGQFRRGGEIPYIEHPKSVVSRVGSDPDAQIVAWLHDVVEDTGMGLDELREKGIPDRCIEAIRLVTKVNGVDYEPYLDRIAESPLATKVKIADMISNLADNPSRKQLKKYARGLVILTRDL